MKKNYLYVVLLLLSNLLAVGQTVTLTPTTVNGASVSTGPINLGSTAISKITLAAEVTLSTPKSNTDPGNIKIYYQKSSTSPSNVTDGGNGGSLLFNGGTSATRSFNITLNLSDFDLTGGYIYAEYKSSTGTAYKSTSISVIKNASPPTPTFPSYPTETKIEAVPYGATPLLPEFVDYPIEYFSAVQSQYWFNGLGDSNIAINTININNDGSYIFLRQNTIFEDGSSSIITDNKVKVHYLKFLPKYENLSVDNHINNNQYLTNDQAPKIIIGNQASETHGTNTSRITNTLTNYQWQTRISFPVKWYLFSNTYLYIYGWQDIPGAKDANYTPPKTSKGMEYRRLVIEPGTSSIPDDRSSATSNIVKILPIKDDLTKNVICCDQTLNNENAETIIGNWEINSPDYQWQVSQDQINWNDIIDAKKKDYTPPPYAYMNVNKTEYYRRIIHDLSNDLHYISNIAKIISVSKKTSNQQTSIHIFPNPASSVINIQKTKGDFSGSTVSIRNINGNVVIQNNFALVDNIITLNISNLTAGYYIVSIETPFGNYLQTYYGLSFIKE